MSEARHDFIVVVVGREKAVFSLEGRRRKREGKEGGREGGREGFGMTRGRQSFCSVGPNPLGVDGSGIDVVVDAEAASRGFST